MPSYSEHVSEEELGCHDGTPYPFTQLDAETNDGLTWGQSRAHPLCRTFERIRAKAGGEPIEVLSAFRTEGYQEALKQAHPDDPAVASASGSQHPKGRALDIRHKTLSAKDLHKLILQMYLDGELPELGGLGLYPTFVHIDVRPRPVADPTHLAQWTGTRTQNTV